MVTSRFMVCGCNMSLISLSSLVFIMFVTHVSAGFSKEVCDSMNPADTVSEQASPVLTEVETKPSQFSINILSKPSYRVNSKVLVRLEGAPFTEFILQARKLGGHSTVSKKRIGMFVDPIPKGAEHLECDTDNAKSVVTHVQNTTKKAIDFTWQAPASNQGSFEFIATIVNETGYWQTIKSITVNFKFFPPGLSDCGKHVGCFIHVTSDENCVEGGCDIVVKTDLADDEKIATFTLGRKEPKESGYVGIGFAEDKDSMDGMVMIACIKHHNKFWVKSFYMEDEKKGFTNTSAYTSSQKHDIEEGMMWCKFQFQLSNTYPKSKDLAKLQYRVYLTGKLDEKNHFPILDRKNRLVSEEPMSLKDNQFIEYTGDSAGHTTLSSIACIFSMLFFILIC